VWSAGGGVGAAALRPSLEMLRGSGAPPKRAGDLVELAPPRLMDPSIGYVVGRRRERGAGEAGDGVEGERGAGEAGDDVGGERGTGGYRAFVYGLLLEWAVQSRPRKFPGLPGIRISGLCLQALAGDASQASPLPATRGRSNRPALLPRPHCLTYAIQITARKAHVN
jgi:hypothetical protein